MKPGYCQTHDITYWDKCPKCDKREECLAELEEIVRELAKISPSRTDQRHVSVLVCKLCGCFVTGWGMAAKKIQDPANHPDDCLWRQAKEWVALYG